MAAPLKDPLRSSPPQLLLLAGPTGAGKSTVTTYVQREFARAIHVGYKYTDRPRRLTDGDWEFRFVDNIPSRLEQYAYSAVGHRYAVDPGDIERAIAAGCRYLVSCTDGVTTQRLRAKFPTVAIYIYRRLSPKALRSLIQGRKGRYKGDLAARLAEVEEALAMYAKHLALYDFVILNTGTVADLECQIEAVFAACGIARAQRRECDSSV